MSEKCRGYLCREEILRHHEQKGYDWKVIVDPTRDDDDPGFFYGRLFRMIDLRLDRDEKSTFPDGILFAHKLTGQRLTIENGQLLDLTHSKDLGRKPRERYRKGKYLTQKVTPNSTLSQMRRFILVRIKDTTGVSGTGVVAEGAVFTDGRSVIHWLREPYAMGIYQTLNDVIAVHGHEGGTELHFIDENEMMELHKGDSR